MVKSSPALALVLVQHKSVAHDGCALREEKAEANRGLRYNDCLPFVVVINKEYYSCMGVKVRCSRGESNDDMGRQITTTTTTGCTAEGQLTSGDSANTALFVLHQSRSKWE